MEKSFKSSETQKQLKRIYRYSFRKGRSVTASFLDHAFLSAIIFFALYIAVRPNMVNGVIARIITFICCIVVLLIWFIADRERFSRHVCRLRADTANELYRTKLILDPEPFLSQIEAEANVFIHHCTDLLTTDDIKLALEIFGDSVTIVSAAEPTSRARDIINRLGGRIKLISPEDFSGRKLSDVYTVEDDEIDSVIISKHERITKKPSLKKGLFTLSKERAFKYIAVGAALFAYSFFVRYSMYFRIMASVTLSLGAMVFTADEVRRRASSD